MEATITLDHGKHLTKPKNQKKKRKKNNKRTKPIPMGLMSIYIYLATDILSDYVRLDSVQICD